MKNYLQRWHSQSRNGPMLKGTLKEVILIGLLPQGGDLELISWTINAVARPGDVVIALIVCYPSSTVVIEDGVERCIVPDRHKDANAQLQLGQFKLLCKQRQIQMDIKFTSGENPEKILIEQATALGASKLVIGTSDRFSWRKRNRSSYCIRNAPAGCSVVVLRNGKVIHYKENQFKEPKETNTNSSYSSVGMHLLHLEQACEDRCHQDLRMESLSSTKVWEINFDVNEHDEGCKNWSQQARGSSPRGVLEGSSLCLDSDSSSSPTRNSFSKAALISSPSWWGDENGEKGFQWRGFLQIWRHRSMHRLSTFPPRTVSRLAWGHHGSGSPSRIDSFIQDKDNSSISGQILSFEKDFRDSPLKPSWKCFTFKELESATSNFSSENLIGKGGYAEVYKGSLPDGQIVAVKRLNRGKTEEKRVADFLTELGIIAHINHPNAARLIGFGVEGGLHIILQFSHNGSLASMLHGTKSQLLNWDIRYRVALGTAQGLLYLHEGCQRRIIHRDIKASNILLTENFEPQISDFGLAKWLPKQWTHHTLTPIEGTFGYLAPEYFMHGIVDEKTDVFAFGVLLLELITGRRPIDSSQQSLVMWAKPLLETRNIKELVDPCLGDGCNADQMNCMVLTAALCVQQSAILRPCMDYVLQLLTGERDDLESSETSSMPLLQSPYLQESSDTEEYTSTRYLSDLSRHREVALEF